MNAASSFVEMNSVHPIQTSVDGDTSSLEQVSQGASEERRDEDNERSARASQDAVCQLPYRMTNYSTARRRRNDAVWDQLMDLRLQSAEGRDDLEAPSRVDEEEEEVIVHRNLLRRRHVRKIQKERAAAAAKSLATSPMQKRSPPQLRPEPSAISIATPPPMTESSPCSFFNDCKPSHSPIRPAASRNLATSMSRPKPIVSTDILMGANTFGSTPNAATASSSSSKKNHPDTPNNHNNCCYPTMSPVRCAKRRKLFSASRTADCVVLS